MTLTRDRCTVVVDDALLMRRIVSRMCAATGAMEDAGVAAFVSKASSLGPLVTAAGAPARN